MPKPKRKPPTPGVDPDVDDLCRRAFAAWFRTGGAHQPSMLGDVADHAGLQYVVLRGGPGPGPLAVYRVRNDSMLKRLRRWPEALN